MKGEIPTVLVSSGRTDGLLELHTGIIVEVGSPSWFIWLQDNTSFRFISGFAGEDSFTARKHERNTGEFWYAYRKVNGKLKNAYLGKSESLNVNRMLEIANKLLQASESRANKTQLGNGYAKECITDKLGNSQLANCSTSEAMEEIQKKLAALQVENDQARSQLENAKAVEEDLRSQLAAVESFAIQYQQKQKMLEELVEKANAKQKGYLLNSFGQGLKDLRNLL
jgi:hypothetical protein